MLSEKVLASIKSITGLSLEEMKKMDIYHEIEYVQYVQKKTGKKLVFSSQPDARKKGRGSPLIARHRFRTIEEVDRRMSKLKW